MGKWEKMTHPPGRLVVMPMGRSCYYYNHANFCLVTNLTSMPPKLTDEDRKIEAKLEAIFAVSSPARAFMIKSVSGPERARPRLRV